MMQGREASRPGFCSRGPTKPATFRSSRSALAWNELGITLREQGRFQDAAAAYGRALELDPQSAAAWRNQAVLQDLYLNDAPAALASFERYRALVADDKAAPGWIAELKVRVAKSATPTGTVQAGGTP